MTSHRGRGHAAILLAAALSVGALLAIGAGDVSAQSPAASPIGSPAASAPVQDLYGDCARLAGLLPSEVDGNGLVWEARASADAADQDSIAPLLQTLGRVLDDFCQVSFHYGTDPLGEGLMWRFGGAAPAILVKSVLDFVTSTDPTITWTRADDTVAGRPVTRLEGTDSTNLKKVFIAYGLADLLVIGQEGPTFERVLSSLPAPGAPLPDVTAPPLPSASPSAAP
jgi:hypothetical protein